MLIRWLRGPAALGCLALMALALTAGRAGAVPAFAVQTGEPCQACHVGGFGPAAHAVRPRVQAAGLHAAHQRLQRAAVGHGRRLLPAHRRRRRTRRPRRVSGATTISRSTSSACSSPAASATHFGAFVQGTYDGVAKAWTWDNLDLRAVTTAKVGKTRRDARRSASTTRPTVQDAWNTLPAWGYPYTGSGLAPAPSASPLLIGALAQTSLGLTGYAWINSEVYLEGGGYWSPSATVADRTWAPIPPIPARSRAPRPTAGSPSSKTSATGHARGRRLRHAAPISTPASTAPPASPTAIPTSASTAPTSTRSPTPTCSRSTAATCTSARACSATCALAGGGQPAAPTTPRRPAHRRLLLLARQGRRDGRRCSTPPARPTRSSMPATAP